jgi:hypothetical protein
MRVLLSALAVLSLALCAAPSFAATSGALSVLDSVQALDASSLKGYSGGAVDPTYTLNAIASASASSTGNSGTFGNNGNISELAMTGNTGLTSIIANTGNMVSISQATTVNVFLH